MVSYFHIFWVFAKIGTFTIGGGYVMIPLLMNEIAGRGWMKEEELPDIIALAQSAPGIIAVNTSIFVGYRLRGIGGSIAATLGSILAPFLFILAIAMVFSDFKDNPTVIKILQGMRPVVVALIIAPTISMARKTNTRGWHWLISIATLGLVAFLKVSPIYILLCVIVIFFSVPKYRKRTGKNIDAPDRKRKEGEK